jgi:N-acetylmuramoyl-L-alanine amidase
MNIFKGKVSNFGGPKDTGMSPSEGLAFIQDVQTAPHLFLSYQPAGTSGLGRRLNPLAFYVACRWDYKATPKELLLGEMAIVRNVKTGQELKAYPADWGPHAETGRVADISPGLMDALGLKTDDEVEVLFPATQRAAAATASTSTPVTTATPKAPVGTVSALPYKRIVISAGHAAQVRGASGALDEVNEARKVMARVAALLTEKGVEVATFADDTSKTQGENLRTIVKYHNDHNRDLDISVHFNASVETTAPMGTEVLYVTQKALAEKLSKAISSVGFKNRGPKLRNELYFLNQTNKPSVLLEVCFVDSEADAALYHEKFEDICQNIVGVLTGK